jgi:hypothetical protein
MNEPQKILNAEQSALVAELTQVYGIEPEEIIFFTGDLKPFFLYEATCVLCNQLTDLHDINIEPMESYLPDSLSLRCTLTLANGDTRSAVGVVNIHEKIDGAKMSEQQVYQLASSRAIRNALRTAGIDLIKLHQLAKSSEQAVNFKVKSTKAALIAQAHLLGKEAFLIIGDEKRPWQHQLRVRYGVEHSNELSEELLADFVAYLRTLVPPPQQQQQQQKQAA